MNTKLLLIIYLAILMLILFVLFASHKKNRKYYAHLNKKEHALIFLYPAAGVIYTLLKKATLLKTKNSVIQRFKRLYVKENVAEEVFLYYIRKISVIIGVILISCVLGLLVIFSHMTSKGVTTIERNDHGKGDAVINLDVAYEDETENIDIVLDEVKLDEKEIKALFEENIAEIEKIMLDENPGREEVSNPLKFINSYNGISIFWDIDRTDIIDFNGEIDIEDKSEDGLVVNLFATLSLEDVSEIYTIPIKVVKPLRSEKELLINDILQNIEKNNSIYDKEVSLPNEALGHGVTFSKSNDDNEHIFIILGILAVIVILLGYDKRLDKDIKKRNEELLLDFSDIVSKLSLLHEAGLSIYKSFERIVDDHYGKNKDDDRFAYREMKMTLEKIRNGMSEREAYAEFGKRCGLHPYIKLGNILEQNLNKGTKGLKQILKSEAKEAMDEKKKLARKKGEEAGTKLLLPMVIMLMIVIVIIAVPALMTIQL